MCSTVSETGIPPRQAFDLPVQHRFVRPTLATVSQARSGPAHDAADPPLGYFIPLVQVIGGGPLLVRAHHFFFAMSCSIVLSRSSSATSLLRRSTSSSVPGIGDRYRPGRERVAVANDSKSSRQCRAYDKSPRLSVLWPDRGRLGVAIAHLVGVPSPAHGSLQELLYPETPISAGPIFGGQKTDSPSPA